MITVGVLVIPLPARAAMTIAPGMDLFQTDPLNTMFSFQDEFRIPPNFFGPGSDPFQGVVHFGGVPLGNFGGLYVGTTDTIVQRKGAADLSSGQANITIELVALSLVSTQPITVTYNGGMTPSFFDVFATLSPSVQHPSTGSMLIRSTGTFDSELTVFPFLTFTRQSDGMHQQLDVGGLFNVICGTNPQQCISDLTLKAFGTPWVLPPCPPDAFIVLTLNDQFCPSTTPTGPVRNIEQSRIDQHSVIPIQEPHWKCYQIIPQTSQLPLKKVVSLRDQFENESGVTAVAGQLLCNPVAKYFTLQRAYSPPMEPHYKCYNLTPQQDPVQLANTTTQFNNDTNVDIDLSQWVCVQTSKLVFGTPNQYPSGIPPKPIPQPTANLKCYSTDHTGKPANKVAMLWDQFHNETTDVSTPSYLCTPALMATSSTSGIVPPIPGGTIPTSPHWMCYNISGQAPPGIKVNLQDSFENESQVIVGNPMFLCAYLTKRSVGPEQPVTHRTPLTPAIILLAVTTITISFALIVRRRKTSAGPINDLRANGTKAAFYLNYL